ncbi:MAG: PrgI family protein [Candidatus Abawacabacteria bacterium]|nr:PrgI family protein [Candidatus Abawacabacteria bacterium]
MAQFKVPQNVQRADTIVGPLTMSGLIIAVVGFGFAYMLYLLLEQPVSTILVVFIVAITAAFALVRIHDMSFAQFVGVITLYMLKPRLRVWEKGSGDVSLADRMDTAPVKVAKKEVEKTKTEPVKQFASLKELTQVLDTDGLSDIDEAEDQDLVHTAFHVNKKK